VKPYSSFDFLFNLKSEYNIFPYILKILNYLFVHSVVYCILCFVFPHLVYLMLPVSLDCPFMILLQYSENKYRSHDAISNLKNTSVMLSYLTTHAIRWVWGYQRGNQNQNGEHKILVPYCQKGSLLKIGTS
jgi:hypothetical protein